MSTTPSAQPARSHNQGTVGSGAESPDQPIADRSDARAARSARSPALMRSLVLTTALITLCVGVFAVREQLYAYVAQLGSDDMPAPLTAVAREMVVPHEVLAGGELQSAEAVDVMCEVEGPQLKIVEMMPEGEYVQSGQIVVRLDPSEINDRLASQQIRVTQANAVAKAAAEELKIQQNLAESVIAEAQLTVTLAELDRKKYLEGEYQVELNDLKGSIALAETDLQDAKDLVEHFENLVRKGFRTPEQLESKQQQVERAMHVLSRDQEKLQVLERFTRERQLVELTANAEETVRELERVRGSSRATVSKAKTDLEVAEATAELEREQLRRIEEQLKLCDVRAPADGTLIYAKDKTKKIELGATVHFKQKLFSLPDLTKIQVTAFVHESEIQQVKIGMQANIKVDAFPDLPLTGRVTDIASYYDSTRHWMSGGVKEYRTSILIEDYPVDVGLKPGMTAQVTIRIGDLSQGVVVPVVAVAEKDGSTYCFRQVDGRLQATEVRLGENTEDFVEVLSGLQVGDRVALDARARLTAAETTPSETTSPAVENLE